MPIKRIRKQKKETKGYSLMGMSASQAYLLTITSRLADNEFRSQTINNAKMRLATQSSQASENYINALNEANLKISNYDEVGNAQQQLLTYNSLTAYSSYNNQYSLVNSAGQVLVSEAEANAFKAAGGSLDNYLKAKGLEYTTTYFDKEDTLNFSAVDEDGAGGYSALAQFGDATTYTYPQLKELYENYNSYDTSPDVKKFDSFHYEAPTITAEQRQQIMKVRENLTKDTFSKWIGDISHTGYQRVGSEIYQFGISGQGDENISYIYGALNNIKNHLKTEYKWNDDDIAQIDACIPTNINRTTAPNGQVIAHWSMDGNKFEENVTAINKVEDYYLYHNSMDLVITKTKVNPSDLDVASGVIPDSYYIYKISDPKSNTEGLQLLTFCYDKAHGNKQLLQLSGTASVESLDEVGNHDVTIHAIKWNSDYGFDTLGGTNSYTLTGPSSVVEGGEEYACEMDILRPDFDLEMVVDNKDRYSLPTYQISLTNKNDSTNKYIVTGSDNNNTHLNELSGGIPSNGDWSYTEPARWVYYHKEYELSNNPNDPETNLINLIKSIKFQNHEEIEDMSEDGDFIETIYDWTNLASYADAIANLNVGEKTTINLHTTGDKGQTKLTKANFLENFVSECLNKIVDISVEKVYADAKITKMEKLKEILEMLFTEDDAKRLYDAFLTGNISGAGDHLNSLDEILKYIATNKGECLSPAYGKYETPKLRSDFLQTNLGKRLIVDLMVDLNGEPKYVWVDSNDRDNTKNADAKAQWYTNLFNRMRQGYKVLENGLASSPEWIEFALSSGIATIEQIDKTNKWQSMDYKSCSTIFEDSDNSAAVAKAEAEYNRAMKDINAKDRVYDLQLKNIDTEHTALQSEYDTVKKIISDNIQRTFQLCKNG